MNFRKIASFLAASSLAVFMANAAKVTLNATNGQVTIEIPDDLAPLVNQNKVQIEQALKDNNVDINQINTYQGKISDFYDKYKEQFQGSTTPFSDTMNGLDDFCDNLVDTIPNTQGIQNIYADAWIGKLIPGAHFGGGINIGASSIDISSLKKTADALDIDMGGINDKLAFPTINADFRIGGIILPFDFGLAVMKLDSSSIGVLENAIDPLSFDYYVIGGDFRYALLKGGMFRPKVSVGAGYYYTSGSFNVKNDEASASLDFSSKAYILEAQASMKLLFLVPFVGTKFIVSKTKVDWAVDANWNKIINDDSDGLAGAINNGLLPSHFDGGSSSTTFHPQVFGGIGFDFFIMSATVTLGYDLKSEIISGAASIRISW